MHQLVIATKNKGKVLEIKHLLKTLKLKISSLLDYPDIPDIKENGKTFKENALKKSSVIAKKFKILTLSDDSGLEVMALNKKPGVRSARYAGPNPTTEKLCGKLLKAMKNKRNRRARFVCNIALSLPNGKHKVIEGVCWGKIGDKMQGSKGFGYDPVFIPRGFKKTFAQMPLSIKSKLSHRGKALKKAKGYLARILGA